MNQHFNDFLIDFDVGQSGNAINIPFIRHPCTDELSKIGKAINISKGIYTLCGGLPGSGKTGFIDSLYVLSLFMWFWRNKENTNIKPYWIYRSMERSIKHKVAKWTCWMLYVEYGIIMDVPTILQWSNKKRDLTAEEQVIIKNYDKFFDKLFQYLDIKQGAENPTGVYKYARRIAYDKGSWITSNDKGLFINNVKKADFNKDVFEEVSGGLKRLYIDIDLYGTTYRIFEYDTKYVARDPNEIVFPVTDHVGKLLAESRDGITFNEKQILDKHYEYNGSLRDICAWNPIDIVQLNRAIENQSRGRSLVKGAKENDLRITNQDFKGSGNGFENADLVLGLLNPYKLDEMSYGGYKIPNFISEGGENRFRSITIVKNSYGVDDISLGYLFLGENSFVTELPTAIEMNRDNSYEAYRNASKELLLN
jgi:hypothetical protein